MFQMNPNLVGTARARLGDHKACLVVESGYLDFGDRLPAVRKGGHLFSMDWVAADGSLDDRIGGASMANSEICFLHFSARKELDQPPMGFAGFGCEKNPCGVFIEPMDDARAERVVSGREILAVSHERVHKGARPMAWSRMDDHACWFIDGENMGVFIENF